MAGQTKKQVGSQREFWEKHLRDYNKSGLSYAEYCRRHDLKGSTFSYWRKKLSASPQGQPAFVELKIAASNPSGIDIILRNQIRLTVCPDFDEGLLEKLIGVLEAM